MPCPTRFPIGAGTTVASFQAWLNKNMRSWDTPLKVDGKCGPLTIAAWKRQSEAELEAAGIPPGDGPILLPRNPPYGGGTGGTGWAPPPLDLPGDLKRDKKGGMNNFWEEPWFPYAAGGFVLLLIILSKKR